MKILINRKSKITIGLIMIAPGLITIMLFFLSILIPAINISIDLPLATLFGFGLIAGINVLYPHRLPGNILWILDFYR